MTEIVIGRTLDVAKTRLGKIKSIIALGLAAATAREMEQLSRQSTPSVMATTSQSFPIDE